MHLDTRGSRLQRSTRSISQVLCLTAVAGIAVGCARARVENLRMDAPAPMPRPGRVMVFDFDTGGSDVRVGGTPRKTARRAIGLSVDDANLVAEAVADALANRLVDEVRALGLAGERAVGAPPPGPNDLVIQGHRVGHGWRAQSSGMLSSTAGATAFL